LTLTFAPPLGQAKVAKEWERWPKAQDAICSDVYRANAFLNAFALSFFCQIEGIWQIMRFK
jgi:hypothetical protein